MRKNSKCNIKKMLFKPDIKITHEFAQKHEDNDVGLIDHDPSHITCLGMKRNTLIKRSLLPLVPGGLIILVFSEEGTYSFIFFPMIVFFCAAILFMNFPILVVRSELRPVYFGNDLFLDREKLPYLELKEEEKKALLNRIKWLLILLNSMLSAALSDYWLFKTHATSSYFEIIGVTGGILKIFQLAAHSGASMFLKKTRLKIFKKVRKNSDADAVESAMESTTASNTIVSRDVELSEINIKH